MLSSAISKRQMYRPSMSDNHSYEGRYILPKCNLADTVLRVCLSVLRVTVLDPLTSIRPNNNELRWAIRPAATGSVRKRDEMQTIVP